VTQTSPDVPRPLVDTEPISPLAMLIWMKLKDRGAVSPDAAVTAAELAEMCNSRARLIGIATAELLERGVMAIANSRGYWLGTLKDGIQYHTKLNARAAEIHGRAAKVKAGILKCQGQVGLFEDCPLEVPPLYDRPAARTAGEGE